MHTPLLLASLNGLYRLRLEDLNGNDVQSPTDRRRKHPSNLQGRLELKGNREVTGTNNGKKMYNFLTNE